MRAHISMVLGVTLLCAIAVGAQETNPRVGTWHLNVAKSKYNPGPAPTSQVVKIEAAGQGEKVTSESVTPTGKVVTQYTANYDGKPYPITGSPTADMVTLKRIDSHTTERTDTKSGKLVQTYRRVVSKDGKTMTVTITGTTADGQSLNNVVVFEKH